MNLRCRENAIVQSAIVLKRVPTGCISDAARSGMMQALGAAVDGAARLTGMPASSSGIK